MPEKRLIDPEALALVSRMELIARKAVEGYLSGLHPSPYYGSSAEYADHRPYAVGDEIRTIDWKLLAKTDKYYVKLFEEQTNCRCTIFVDTSKSMSFQSGKHRSKLDYSLHAAAALAYLLLNQNDAVGLVLFDSKVRNYLPARSTATHFRHMIGEMAKVKPGADTNTGRVLHELAGRIRQRGITILISDLIDDADKVADGLSHFCFKKHDVIVFQVLDPAELSFPYERRTCFRDIEGSGRVFADPQSVRNKYLERLELWLESVRRICHERDISYELATTETPYAELLSACLEKRSRMTG